MSVVESDDDWAGSLDASVGDAWCVGDADVAVVDWTYYSDVAVVVYGEASDVTCGRGADRIGVSAGGDAPVED